MMSRYEKMELKNIKKRNTINLFQNITALRPFNTL